MKKLIALNVVGLAVVITLAALLFNNASSSLDTLESLQAVVAAQQDAAEYRRRHDLDERRHARLPPRPEPTGRIHQEKSR
ncbi:MAG: hypothetical protein QM736_17955 [Vicinamibacterales bacterium]